MLTSFAEGTLFGTRTGDRPTVLGLHGWGGTSAQLAAALSPFPSALLDLPGFGASPAPPEAWGAAEYAEALVPVLDNFETPPVVVGFSFGGRIAVHLAATYPKKVAALVLTGAPLLRPATSRKPAFGFRLLRRAHGFGLISEERMETERQKRGSADYRNASGIMRAVLVRAVNETYEDQLSEIDCRVEMVWGSDDTAAPVALAEQVAATLTNAHLTVIKGRSHSLPMEEPGAVTAAVRRCGL